MLCVTTPNKTTIKIEKKCHKNEQKPRFTMIPFATALAEGSLPVSRRVATKGCSLMMKCLIARFPPENQQRVFFSTLSKPGNRRYFDPSPVSTRLRGRGSSCMDTNKNNELEASARSPIRYHIPKHVRHKLTSASDAVALVRDGDTVCVSGFVTQGAPEAVLKALGDRFEANGKPCNLTLLFGGGPGDYGERGLSHLAKVNKDGTSCMLRRAIGGHFGQVPKIAELCLKNQVEAWTLPMGSISRMIRAQSTHSPGHITSVGIGTYVDPDISGGAANDSALKSHLHSNLISKLTIDGQTNLMYKALPIDVAIIRGTTADAQGNISVEHESLLCDQKITAAAAKNSGGIVIAQVKRIAADSSISSREVAIPGALVDCVVVVDEKDHDTLHGMSYEERHNPAFTGELKTPQESIEKMSLDIRKIIARRGVFALKPNTIVNLGIGLPEGIASVATEEGMLEYITLSTEPGVFGGLPASGKSFGPAYNASSLLEMNQMFDFYDGGGLNMCFLGAAQVSPSGDVNVSRMSRDTLTGPGGFIDISQSTKNICFMMCFTTKGLEVTASEGSLNIKCEGRVKKFVSTVFEKTFSGDEGVRRGQTVFYVTERCVFRRSSESETIELIEIAPGVDLQTDILDQMEFTPSISSDLKYMDSRIFTDEKMEVAADFFGSLEERCVYHAADHTMFIDLFGITLNTQDDINWFIHGIRDIISSPVGENGPIDMVVNYNGFDVAKGLEDTYSEKVRELEQSFYKSVKRYTGHAFQRAKLKTKLGMRDWDADKIFDQFSNSSEQSDVLSLAELRNGFFENFHVHLTPSHIRHFLSGPSEATVDRKTFAKGVIEVLGSTTSNNGNCFY